MSAQFTLFRSNDLWGVGRAVVIIEIDRDSGGMTIADTYVVVLGRSGKSFECHVRADVRALGDEGEIFMRDCACESARTRLQLDVVDPTLVSGRCPPGRELVELSECGKEALNMLGHFKETRPILSELAKRVKSPVLSTYLRLLDGLRVEIVD